MFKYNLDKKLSGLSGLCGRKSYCAYWGKRVKYNRRAHGTRRGVKE